MESQLIKKFLSVFVPCVGEVPKDIFPKRQTHFKILDRREEWGGVQVREITEE